MSPSFSNSKTAKTLASWKWVLAYTAAILLTLTLTRRVLDWLAERNLSGLLGLLLLVTAIACLFFLLRRIRRVRGGLSLSTGLRLLAFLGLYLFFLFSSTDLTVDRIHFIEYGILGLLCFQAVGPGVQGGRRVAYAMVAVFTVAFLDESIQGVLPGRYFDVRDVVIDLLAGGLPVLGLFLLPLQAEEKVKRMETPMPTSVEPEGRSRDHRVSDVSTLLLALLLFLGVLWAGWVSWDMEPLYGEWRRENRCGSIEWLRIEADGNILWKESDGGKGRGTYRVRGNRLDGPLLEVQVRDAEGDGPCAWKTGEGRHRYFHVDEERLLFKKEKEFPFRRVEPTRSP